MDNKIITIGPDTLIKIQEGVNILADTVKATLGPAGMNVIIEKDYGTPISTKDGVSVAREIKVSNPVVNNAVQLVKEAAARTAAVAGDGTTTATVLAQSLFNTGLEFINLNNNAVQIKRGMEYACVKIVDYLRSISTDVTDDSLIEYVGTISANNDKEIGKLISTAMQRVGRDGIVTVQKNTKTAETYLEVVEGMQIDSGYASPYFIDNQQSMNCILENPYILLCNKRLNNVKELLPLLEKISRTGSSLLIISDDIIDEALAALIVNKVKGLLTVCAVKSPYYGETRSYTMEDLSVITGGMYFTEERGVRLDKIELDQLGKAKKIEITKNRCTIIDGEGDPEKIKERAGIIRKQIDDSESDYEKEKMITRLGKFTGGVAILHIGANTEPEMKEKCDRIDDALQATKAAVEEGIVPGGGVALLNASKIKIDTTNLDESQRIGVDIVQKACVSPFMTILSNAGINYENVLPLLDGTDPNKGYNALTCECTNMIDSGIIDPTKVTRTALENAVSIAGLLLTTKAIVSKEPKQDKPAGMDQNMLYDSMD